MKKAVVILILMLAGAAVPVCGQTNSGAAEDRHLRQASGSVTAAEQKDTAKDQKMSQEAKQDIAALMKQTNEAMQKMTDTFENKAGTENRNLPVMGKMMREISRQMNEMATIIEKGRIDPQTLTNMRARTESVIQRIDAIQ